MFQPFLSYFFSTELDLQNMSKGSLPQQTPIAPMAPLLCMLPAIHQLQQQIIAISISSRLTIYTSVISGNLVTTSYVRQSISNLQAGLTYNISVDLKAVVNPVYSITEQCFFYIYHDSLTTNDLITQLSRQYTRADSSWATYGGAVTPASSNMDIGMVLSCSPYHTSVIFNACIDNAVMQGEHPSSLSLGVVHTLRVHDLCVISSLFLNGKR